MKSHDLLQVLYFSKITKFQNYTYRWCNIPTALHQHLDFYELCLITDGCFENHYKNEIYPLSKGALCIYNVGEIHKIVPSSLNARHFSLCISKSFFQLLTTIFTLNIDLFVDTNYISCQLKPAIYDYLHLIANNITNEKSEFNNVKLFFYSALMSIIQDCSAQQSSASDTVTNDIIEKIRNYTYLNLPVSDIYARYNYSPATIIGKFKQQTGMSIIQYQNDIKLQYAASLLRETDFSIEQIINEIGFVSSSHFYSNFKKRYKLTPQQYRIAASNNPEDYNLLLID